MHRWRPRRALVWLCALAAAFAWGLGDWGGGPGSGGPGSGGDKGSVTSVNPGAAWERGRAQPTPRTAASPPGGGVALGAADGSAPAPNQKAGGVKVGPATARAATSSVTSGLRARQAPRQHIVQPGETIWDIAQQYGVDIQSILTTNQLGSGDLIRVGQKLTILPVQGIVHRVEQGESLWDISRRYGVGIDDLVQVNGLQDPDQLQVRQELLIPGVTEPVEPREQPVVVNGRLRRAFSWPVRGTLTSRFGRRWGRLHEGIDIGVDTGTPVRAAAAGVVSYAGWGGGYGYLVIIDHGNGVETRYAHNSRILVEVGQHVERGEVISQSGSTGRSTGPHVHFEIRQYREAVDPLRYLL